MPINVVNFQQGLHFVNSVYLDSNVLGFARDRKSQKYHAARIIIGELLAQRINIFVSDLVIDEVWWTLLGSWYKADTQGKLTKEKIRNDPTILPKYYRRLKLNTTKILGLPNLIILPFRNLPRDRIIEALNFFTSHNNLMPRDSFHLALAELYNIDGFITSDSDFNNLNIPFNLILYKY